MCRRLRLGQGRERGRFGWRLGYSWGLWEWEGGWVVQEEVLGPRAAQSCARSAPWSGQRSGGRCRVDWRGGCPMFVRGGWRGYGRGSGGLRQSERLVAGALGLVGEEVVVEIGWRRESG